MKMDLPLNLTNATAENLANLVNFLLEENQQNTKAGNAIWILTSAFIIFTMQSGFSLLEAGT